MIFLWLAWCSFCNMHFRYLSLFVIICPGFIVFKIGLEPSTSLLWSPWVLCYVMRDLFLDIITSIYCPWNAIYIFCRCLVASTKVWTWRDFELNFWLVSSLKRCGFTIWAYVWTQILKCTCYTVSISILTNVTTYMEWVGG